MVGEICIMENRYIILVFCFLGLFGCTVKKYSTEGLYISDISPHSVYPDSLIFYKDKSFKLNYNDYGNLLSGVIFGNWVQCGNRLHLIPENFVRKIIEEKDTTLNDSVAISVYDYELDHYRFKPTYTCYLGGQVLAITNDSTSKINFNQNFIFHYKSYDSIKVVADDFLNSIKQEFRPVITPKPNTRYTIYSRFTGTGFFLERNFYIKKRGKQIYVQWDKELYKKWKSKSDGKEVGS